QSRGGLATASSLIIGGVLLHRLNVTVIGLRVRHWETYVPSLGEVGITLGITPGARFVFGGLVSILPVPERLSPGPGDPGPAGRPMKSCRRHRRAGAGPLRRPGHYAARGGCPDRLAHRRPSSGARQPDPDRRADHPGARRSAARSEPARRPGNPARCRGAAPVAASADPEAALRRMPQPPPARRAALAAADGAPAYPTPHAE